MISQPASSIFSIHRQHAQGAYPLASSAAGRSGIDSATSRLDLHRSLRSSASATHPPEPRQSASPREIQLVK
jgi:hypothetical protein